MKGKLSNPSGPHLSEALVRRYELIFERFLNTYPAPFVCEPSEFAPSTVCSQLRMAANALIHFGPGSDDPKFSSIVDCDRLRELWPSVQVTIRDKKVVIGTKEAQKEVAIELVNDRVSSGLKLIEVENPSYKVLDAFATLFSERALTDPVIFKGTVPPVGSLPPGIVLESNSDGTYTML